MIMPKLVYKPVVKKEAKLENTVEKLGEEKENDGTQIKSE